LRNILFKYRNWSSLNHRKLLIDQEIYFPSADKFNDPFDSNIKIRYDKGSKEDILKLYFEDAKTHFPEESYEKLISLSEQKFDRGLHNDPKLLSGYFDDIRKLISETFGIFTLSAKNGGLLLWSNYADSHRGFAIGFNSERLMKSLREVGKHRHLIFDIFKVCYEKEYPLLNPYEMTANEIILVPLKTKSCIWQYEKEYRIICLNKSNFLLRLDNDIIDSVILGCKIPMRHRKEIISALRIKGKDISLFQAYEHNELYALELKEITY